MEGLGKRIKKLRRIKGFTLPELAEKAEVSKSYLWRIEESGNEGSGSSPSAKTLEKISRALEVSLFNDELFHTHELPESLVEYVVESRKRGDDITEEDIRMLSCVHYRGRRPSQPEDWDYIFKSIKKSVD